MWNIPTKSQLEKIPKLYETEKIPCCDKRIYVHFFLLHNNWYVAEYDGDSLFFGFCLLENYNYGEWGYFDYEELKDIKVDGWLEVDCETEENWIVRKASEIENIKCL